MISKIKEFIRKNEEVFGKEKVSVEKLPFGAWNFNYMAKVGDKKYVFKIYSKLKSFGFFSNLGETEYKALKLVEDLGIAPKTVIFDDSKAILDNDVLVYEYLEGGWLKKEEDSVKKVAEILAKLHSLDIGKADFLEKKEIDLKEILEEINKEFEVYQTKENKDVELEKELKEFIKKLEIRSKTKLEFDLAVVHTDLVPSNIVEGKTIKLIDWQRPWLGDVAFDCWAFTSDIFNYWDWKETLTEKQIETFWQKYLELNKDKDVRKRVEIKAPFYYVRLLLYCLNKFCDYKAGKWPKELIEGREHHFEKYGKIFEMCFDNLRRML
jgi:thiamine kinase-like enzyme